MAHNGQPWPPRAYPQAPQQHNHYYAPTPAQPYAYPPPTQPQPQGPAPTQPNYRNTAIPQQRAPSHHAHPHQHQHQYGGAPYGMPYGVPPGFPYGAAPPAHAHAPAHGQAPAPGYGAPAGPPHVNDLPPGSAPRRISPTSSWDSTMRSIDNAIAPRPMQGAPPGGPPGGPHGYAPPYNFRTGSTISLGSFGDYDPSGLQHPAGGSPGRPVDAERARKAFNEANKDKSGYITFREFLQSLADLRLNIAYHDALDKFSKLDIDKDGRVVETEFVNGYIDDKFGSQPSAR